MPYEATKLVLGRGEVYFDRFLTGTKVGEGERYFGNTPSFQIQREIVRLERATAYRGQRHTVRGPLISEKVSMIMTTDHMATDNVALWYSGAAAVAISGDEFTPFTEALTVRKSRFYQLGTATVIGGMRFIDSAEVRLGAVDGTLLTAGVHYILDRTSGRLEIPSTSPLADDSAITAIYTKRPSPLSSIEMGTQEAYGGLRYIAKDPYGPKVDYWFPEVRITPRGGLDLKVDEFRQMSFDIEPTKLTPAHALMYAIIDSTAPVPITADTNLVTADSNTYSADNGTWDEV